MVTSVLHLDFRHEKCVAARRILNRTHSHGIVRLNNKEVVMTVSEDRLLSLLFEEGRVLDNLKFFPGEECASSEELFDEAFFAISEVLSGKSKSVVPMAGNEKLSHADFVASL